MTETGIFFRRACKVVLQSQPPKPGEMVFATDSGEHGWLDENNVLVWKLLLQDKGGLGGSTGLELIYEDGKKGWRLISKNPILYEGTGNFAVDISESSLDTINSGASGDYSFAASLNTIAQNRSQTSLGQFNIGKAKSTIFEIGIGEEEYRRRNALEVHTDGTVIAPSASVANMALLPKALITNEFLSHKGGLERLEENNIQGWRLFLGNKENFGNIGHKAVDLSTSTVESDILGATGRFSFATGANSEAKGTYSTATGAFNSAEGSYSTAMGAHTKAPADVEVVMGRYNIGTDLTNIFEIGYGKDEAHRLNLFEVNQEGPVLAPNLEMVEIQNPRCLITKEYFDANKTGQFITLPDTPSTYIADKFVVVNQSGTGLDFVSPPEGLISQLEIIYETGKQGWRLYGKDRDNYADIGNHAVDLSNHTSARYGHGASGDYSFSLGYGQASGRNSVSFGGAEATGAYSFATGDAIRHVIWYNGTVTRATGAYSHARGRHVYYGYPTRADGNYSTAVGVGAKASGSYSDVVGYISTGSGTHSFSRGFFNTVGGYCAAAIGHRNNVSGAWSAAIGGRLIVPSSYCTVVGTRNVGENVGNLFEVGNGLTSGAEGNGYGESADWGDSGSEEVRSNALEVHRTGVITAPKFDSTAYSNPSQTNPKFLVTLEYLKIYTASLGAGNGAGSGLEVVAEASKRGWRLAGTEPDYYGDTGQWAIDMSFSNSYSTSTGATGDYSFSGGYRSSSSGDHTFAYGAGTLATTGYSVALGRYNNPGFEANYGYPIFTLGIGSGNLSRRNAMAMFSSGQILAKECILGEIEHPKTLVTKEYVDFKNNTGLEKVLEEYSNTGTYKQGWRFVGINPLERRNIGTYAIDMTVDTTYSGASGDYSFAIGRNNDARNISSVAMGANNTAWGDYSAVVGVNNIAYGRSGFIAGENNESHNYSVALGYGIKATSRFCLSVGTYNYPEQENLFEVGYGSSSTSRKNVFKVNKYGVVQAPSLSIDKIVDQRCLITKEYFDAYNSGSLLLLIDDTETDLDTTWSSTYINTNMASKEYVQNSVHMIRDNHVLSNKTWSSHLINAKISPLASKIYVDDAIGQITIDSGFNDNTISLYSGWSSQRINDTYYTKFQVDEKIHSAIEIGLLDSFIDDTINSSLKTYSSSKITTLFTGYNTISEVDAKIASIIDDNTIVNDKTWSSYKIGDKFNSMLDDNSTATSSGWSSSKIQNSLDSVLSQVSASNGNLKSDGTVPMDSGYVPVVALDLVTKDYFESNSSLSTFKYDGKGYHILDRNELYYGEVGTESIDLSFSNSVNTLLGATGNYSFAINGYTTASGNFSSAFGNNTIASKEFSFAVGVLNEDKADTILEIGNGNILTSTRSNALEVYLDGRIIAPGLDIIVDDKSLITKEYFHNNSAGSASFSGLTDTPDTLLPNKFVVINGDGTGIDYIDEPSGEISQLKIYNTGWALAGRNENNYGNTGLKSLDLSFSNSSSTSKGATGATSLALNYSTTASGKYSIASGDRSIASGESSFSSGKLCKSTHNYSFSVGHYSTASGSNSFSCGSNTTASGVTSFASGDNSTASGVNSFSCGDSTVAQGESSFSSGKGSIASHSNSTAMGYYSIASGPISTAIGENCTSSGDTSFSTGVNTTASGNYSFSAGNYTKADGNNSFSTGFYSEANGISSLASGNGVKANGKYSTALGDNTIALNANSLSLGKYNVGTNTDNILEIGNGTSSARKNIVEVNKNGAITNTVDITNITDDNHLITKKYLEENSSSSQGLEYILEDGKNGWRLPGWNEDNFGNIGNRAIDMSRSSLTSTTNGATGNYSVAIGLEVTASGTASFASGEKTVAGGAGAVAFGLSTIALNANSLSLGKYNVGTNTDNILEIGNGTNTSTRSNALELNKNGTVKVSAELVDITSPKHLVTKEYVDAKPIKNPRTRIEAVDSQTVFDAGFTIDSDSLIYVDGIIQPLRVYTISGTQVIFNDFMSAGTDVIIML